MRAIVQRIGGAGAPGPAGPAGPAGPTGPAGADGADGADGVDALGWTYAILASDFVTGSTTPSVITGLEFTPAADKTYEFEAKVMVRTATTTVGPRVGVKWGTYSDGAVSIRCPSSGTTEVQAHDGVRDVVNLNTGLAVTTVSYLVTVDGMVVAGATPTGSVQLRLQTETAATNVTARARSFIRWRELPA